MVTIRLEKPSDAAAREALLDAAYGPIRFEKPSERLRSGRAPARGLSFVAVEGGQNSGKVIGTVRLWDVSAGSSCPVLLLGPLAVDPAQRRQGIGAALMRHAVRVAARHGHRAVLLVGDSAYYSRFGFSAEKTGGLWLPGLTEKSRLLGRELNAGALDGVRGAIRTPAPKARRSLVPAIAPLPAPRAA